MSKNLTRRDLLKIMAATTGIVSLSLIDYLLNLPMVDAQYFPSPTAKEYLPFMMGPADSAQASTPTTTHIPSATATQTTNPIPTQTATSTPTQTATLTPTQTATPTPTSTPTPTNTAIIGQLNPNPPAGTQRLIFIHHSTGQNWLADDNGQLGIALCENNYFVSDTNYGWGPSGIGDLTDIGHWYDWYNGASRDIYLAALYVENGQHCSYSRLPNNPGGENAIILFKSCFPNSGIYGNPYDPPTTGDNPLRSQPAGTQHQTVGNIKGIYVDLLTYFSSRLDKLFIVITAPPLVESATDVTQAANARAINTWLVNDWLSEYPYLNVAVFDFYNVLTSNGGNPNTNDAGWETGNHHRYRNSSIEYTTAQGSNYSQYGISNSDSHPTPVGGQKASMEFLPLLNIFYHRWAG